MPSKQVKIALLTTGGTIAGIECKSPKKPKTSTDENPKNHKSTIKDYKAGVLSANALLSRASEHLKKDKNFLVFYEKMLENLGENSRILPQNSPKNATILNKNSRLSSKNSQNSTKNSRILRENSPQNPFEIFGKILPKNVANIDSCDMTDEIWLKLAKKCERALRKCAAAVIAHGTDTMEETAFFLDLVLQSPKPVVLCGAMLPASAKKWDGARNLFDAMLLATRFKARGVAVVMAHRAFDAKSVTKAHTTNLDAFKGEQIAQIRDGEVIFEREFLDKISEILGENGGVLGKKREFDGENGEILDKNGKVSANRCEFSSQKCEFLGENSEFLNQGREFLGKNSHKKSKKFNKNKNQQKREFFSEDGEFFSHKCEILGENSAKNCDFCAKNSARQKPLKFDICGLKTLPKVDILYTYSNDGSGAAAKALFAGGAKGLVIASSGAGSIHAAHKATLKRLVKGGLKVVIAPRISGSVHLNRADARCGFISAHALNPQKARILLALALTRTKSTAKIAKIFAHFA